MQILHNVCWYCYRILWLFMIIWWHGFEKWDLIIDYFQHKRSDMINHNHHYYLIIIIYIISHSSILCSLSLCFINCRFTVAISNCTPLEATWWETFHWDLTCVKRLTTGELAPNEPLSNNIIVRYWIIWSTIWAWPNVDWTVTILSDSSLFISGHYVSWDSYIHYPLFKNVSFFGWIHECSVSVLD